MIYSRVAMVVSMLLLLAGCLEPTLDTTTDEALKATSQKIREKLPEAQRAEFDESIKTLMFSELNLKNLFKHGADATAADMQTKFRDVAQGKTGAEIIAEAERVRAERKERERVQAMGEIDELLAKQAKAASAREEMKKFEVSRSRYSRKDGVLGKTPVVELSVKNGMHSAVSRVFFKGTIASPDRSVPWLVETFNYKIAGGLEPNETAEWKLSMNRFSAWSNDDIPGDAVFTVTVEKLLGADGETLSDARDFSERDAKRLAELTEKYQAK